MERVAAGSQLLLLAPRQAILASAISNLVAGSQKPRDIFVMISGGEARATPLRLLEVLHKSFRSGKSITHDDIIDLFRAYTRVDPKRGLNYQEFTSLCHDITVLKSQSEKRQTRQEVDISIPDPVEYLRQKLIGYLNHYNLSKQALFRKLDTSKTGVIRPQQFRRFVDGIRLPQSNKPGTADRYMRMSQFNETLTDSQWLAVFQFLQSFDRSPNLMYDKFGKLLSYTNPKRAASASPSVPSVRYGNRLKPHVAGIGDPNYLDTFPTVTEGETYEERRQKGIDEFAASLKQVPAEFPLPQGQRQIVQEYDNSPNEIQMPHYREETSPPRTIQVEAGGVSVIPGKALAFMSEPTKAQLPVGGFLSERSPSSIKSLLDLIRDKIYQRVHSTYSLFQSFNVSRTGALTFDELRHGLGSVNVGLSRNDLQEVLRFGGWMGDLQSSFSMDYKMFCDFLGNNLEGSSSSSIPKSTTELYGRVEPRRSSDIRPTTPGRHDGLNESMGSSQLKNAIYYSSNESQTLGRETRMPRSQPGVSRTSNNTQGFTKDNGLGYSTTCRPTASHQDIDGVVGGCEHKTERNNTNSTSLDLSKTCVFDPCPELIAAGRRSSDPPPTVYWQMGIPSPRNTKRYYEQTVRREDISPTSSRINVEQGDDAVKAEEQAEYDSKVIAKHVQCIAVNMRERLIQRCKTAALLFKEFDEERLGSFGLPVFRAKIHSKFGFNNSDTDINHVFALINTSGSGFVTFKELANFLEI